MQSRTRHALQANQLTLDYTNNDHANDGHATRLPFSFSLAFSALHDDQWKLLGFYSLYKLILASILIFANASPLSPLGSLNANQPLFDITVTGYLFVTIFNALLIYLQRPNFDLQLYLNILIDVLALLLLIYSSNSLTTSFSLLLIVPLFSINLLRPGQYSIFITALSIIGLLVIALIHNSDNLANTQDVFQTGLLSLFLLSCSWLASVWAKKANDAAALVKRRELDIANLSQLNQSILDELQSGILVVERYGSIKHMNTAAWEILGKPNSWRSLPLGQFAPELNKHLQIWLDNVCPKIVRCDIRHQHSMELRVRFTQLGTHSKATTLIHIEDMSELRERLQDAKLASLGQLTANIAHEIRNPLGAISHSAQLLSESQNLDKVDTRMVQIIQRNSKRMNLTIESVLNLSRKKNPKQEPILLQTWLREFLDDFIMQTKLKQDQVKLFVSPADCVVSFDPAHLHQILWNLCRNAAKYARPNDVHNLRLDVHAGLPDHSRDITLSVMDNGKGISTEQQQRLFEPFFTTSDTGTGLGLFMARELSLSNGASLDYLQLPRGGSCFRLVFTKSQQ